MLHAIINVSYLGPLILRRTNCLRIASIINEVDWRLAAAQLDLPYWTELDRAKTIGDRRARDAMLRAHGTLFDAARKGEILRLTLERQEEKARSSWRPPMMENRPLLPSPVIRDSLSLSEAMSWLFFGHLFDCERISATKRRLEQRLPIRLKIALLYGWSALRGLLADQQFEIRGYLDGSGSQVSVPRDYLKDPLVIPILGTRRNLGEASTDCLTGEILKSGEGPDPNLIPTYWYVTLRTRDMEMIGQRAMPESW